MAQPSAASKSAAVVNGQPIPRAELEAALRQAGSAAAQLSDTQRQQLRGEALRFLIDRAVMRQFLTRHQVPVHANEVAGKMAELEAALRAQGQSLQEFCRERHQSVEQLRDGVAADLQWQTYARQHLSDADLARFYQENKDFFDRTSVRVSHILLRLTPAATPDERTRARARLVELRRQIIAGKLEFAAAARAHSQCPIADRNGDLGFVLRKWMLEEPLARAAFALKVGEVSDVIETEYGLHLLKVTDRKNGTPSDFARIKAQVADVCIEDLYFTVLAAERQKARIEVMRPE